MNDRDSLTLAFKCDTREFKREISEAERLARGFGVAVTRSLASAVVQGRSLRDVLRSLALQLSNMAVSAALKPLERGIGDLFESIFGKGLPLPKTFPSGPQSAAPLPFASGGVIATPTYFPLGPALGVAGERGAEAILPLARGADGKLGVRAESEARPLNVTVNISTPDAASFRRSEAYVSGAIARAVARGERSL